MSYPGLGLYTSNPNGNDAGAMAQYETNLSLFVAAVGQPTHMNAFTDYSLDPSQWAGNASWAAWSWSQSPTASKLIPVVGVPMAPQSAASNNIGFFQDTAAGKYDDVWTGIAQAWAAHFPVAKFRLGYEMNGGFMPWFMGGEEQWVQDWIAAFRQIAKVIRAAFAGAVTEWNPASINWTGVPTADSYPGDDVVDICALDTYSPCYEEDFQDWNDKPLGFMEPDAPTWLADPVNRRHFWTRPGATQYQDYGAGWGLEQHIAFAKAHGKPIAISECGTGNKSTSTGPLDDPEFPTWLRSMLDSAVAQGVTVDHVNIWATDQGDGAWGFFNGEHPLEAAAWKSAFGDASVPAPAPAPAPAPSPAQTTGVATAVLTDKNGKSVTLQIEGVKKDYYANDTGLASNVYVYANQAATGWIIQPDNSSDLPTIVLTTNGLDITPEYFNNVTINKPSTGPATADITDRTGKTVTLDIVGVQNFYAGDTGLVTNIYVYENSDNSGLVIQPDNAGDAPTIVLTTNGQAVAPNGFTNVTVK